MVVNLDQLVVPVFPVVILEQNKTLLEFGGVLQ